MYPVMLNVRNRRCLVVGGGGIALRKVEGLLKDGAEVTVIAPRLVDALEKLENDGRIRIIRRIFEQDDVRSFSLVFAATDDNEVNRLVFENAEKEGIWVNVADEPDLCSFHLPGRLQRDALQIVVASGGDAPFVVRRLRRLLEGVFGPEWSEWIQAAARFRKAVRDRHLTPSQEQACFDRFFNYTVDRGRLTVRVPSRLEEEKWIEATQPETESQALSKPDPSGETKPPQAETVGFVSLVGAGPGDSGLLTVRGRNRILSADAVVYDHLAETVLPCELPEKVELHPVGKKAGYHPVPQEEIVALLERLAREGKRVVRLKGGDPFVFGRGGEEAEELERLGIPYEVVPCVTAGIAAPAYGGIPVTHRREAVRLTLLTAHESSKENGPQMRWDLLAQDPASTLVGYMGVTSLPRVVERLLAGGMAPEMPAAMIERGTTSAQRMVAAHLKDLPNEVERAGIQPPAVFVIGPTVGHHQRLDWFSRRPLSGQRIVVPKQLLPHPEKLEIAGAEVVEVSFPLTPAARIVIDALPVTGCLVGSTDDVELLDEERSRPGWGSDIVTWCMSSDAFLKAQRLGWRNTCNIEPFISNGIEIVEIIKNRFRPDSLRNSEQGGGKA